MLFNENLKQVGNNFLRHLAISDWINGSGLIVLKGEEEQVDEQTNNRVMNQNRFRETNRSAAQSFEPGA